MDAANNRNRMRRNFSLAAMAALLGVSAIGLTQCRMIDDSVTGVDTSSASTVGTYGAHKDCIHKCNHIYKDAAKAEECRHRTALRECKHDSACRKAENDKHKQIHDQIVRDRISCKKGCYHEGGGKGGR